GGLRPEELADQGTDESMVELWSAMRSSLRSVLDGVTIADLAAGLLPAAISDLASRSAGSARTI
ncbi:MAG TPA: hypothetical protein PLV68_09190, partial [Ilumatobacteraceae bacterium]|nr:hypothetical protein [Ilumatobacteraceae bacterium]